jgi:hypothetical protein
MSLHLTKVMSKENTALTYTPINAQEAVLNDDYLAQASQNVFAWEESDKEMAQGRTNFQIEKFIGLNTHNISVSFEHILKERRIMASGYMFKLIEMKERVREFEYKWNGKDKTQPIMWETGGPGGGKKLCWYDLEELELTHYLKGSEMEIRDRLHQMQHLDKMLDKLVEQNGGTYQRAVPGRESRVLGYSSCRTGTGRSYGSTDWHLWCKPASNASCFCTCNG